MSERPARPPIDFKTHDDLWAALNAAEATIKRQSAQIATQAATISQLRQDVDKSTVVFAAMMNAEAKIVQQAATISTLTAALRVAKEVLINFPKDSVVQGGLDVIDAALAHTQERCADCDEAGRHANSDATTPGFFYDKCSKHRAHTQEVKP